MAKVEHVGHGLRHSSWLGWGACHLHLLLDELRLQELDLLLLVHHDVLVDQLLLFWGHLGHVGNRCTWLQLWVLHHASEASQEIVHTTSGGRVNLRSRDIGRLGRGGVRLGS